MVMGVQHYAEDTLLIVDVLHFNETINNIYDKKNSKKTGWKKNCWKKYIKYIKKDYKKRGRKCNKIKKINYHIR